MIMSRRLYFFDTRPWGASYAMKNALPLRLYMVHVSDIFDSLFHFSGSTLAIMPKAKNKEHHFSAWIKGQFLRARCPQDGFYAAERYGGAGKAEESRLRS